MKHPRLLLATVLIVTILSLIINFTQAYTINIGSYQFKFPGIDLSVIPGMKRDFAFKEGLDLAGGTSITLKADMKGVPIGSQQVAVDSAKAVIERRINPAGVSEALVQTVKVNNDYRIVVAIPGVTDVKQALELVGKTAKLSFWESKDVVSDIPEFAKIATNTAELTKLVQLSQSKGVPLSILQALGTNAKKTNLTGADLKQATVTFDPNTGKPQVGLAFTTEGAKKFGEITKRNIGRRVVIALDNDILSPPMVNEAIFGVSAVITGYFTIEEANTIQRQLNAGALPVSLSVLEQSVTGATLGAASLQKSLFAGFIGFIVIILFMVVLYGRLGVIASLALIVYMLIVLSLFRLIPVTLTLAGIAGFILSIGVAVDANILIFERMKEEIRRGITREHAIDLGFSRAWPSIRDSNVSSLITSAILYYFGTTIVRGFALTLALGVLVSMFSAIVVTRTLLRFLYKN